MRLTHITEHAPTGVQTVTTVLVEGLGVNRSVLTAGGAGEVCHYAQLDPGTAEWSVNGQVHSELLVQDAESRLWCSEIEVSASVAGPVEVTCNGHTLEMEAV